MTSIRLFCYFKRFFISILIASLLLINFPSVLQTRDNILNKVDINSFFMSDMCFIENRGQWSKDIIYRSYLNSESIIDVKSHSINIYSMNSPQFLTITFPLMRYISLEGVCPSSSISNYYKGSDNSKWAENCKHYSRLRINEIH